MKKRLICIIIVVAMLVQPIIANVQIQVKNITVDEVFYIVGQDMITGNPIIRPTMTVGWEEPDSWAGSPSDSNYHTPDGYFLSVKNRTFNDTKKIEIKGKTDIFNKKSIKVHDKLILNTGSLYEVFIEPYHYHIENIGGEDRRVLAPTSGAPKKVYAITDLNVELKPGDNSIDVVFDDLGISDFEYRIVYAVGDYSNKTKQELINNKEGEINNLTRQSSNVKSFYDTEKKRNRLSFTIDQNVYPGQIYSVMVEPVTQYFEGNPIVKNVNYPYIWTCSTNINLKVLEDGEYVRLEWKIPASFKVGQDQSEYELVEAKLVEYINDSPSNIAIFNKDAATMEYYRVRRPSKPVKYQLQLTYKVAGDDNKIPIKPESKKVPFVPNALRVKPTKPKVPKLMTKSILNDLKIKPINEIKAELEGKYLVDGDSYNDNISNLLEAKRTFSIMESNNTINFVWNAFRRKDVLIDSPTYGQNITDTDVYYDIYVTKDIESLAGATRIIDNKKYDKLTPNNIIKSKTTDEIIGFKCDLGFYYEKGETQLQKITPGNLYYIKIVAKKKWGSEEIISEPTIVSLYYGYNGDSFEPPSVVKPPLKVKDKDTTTTDISIIWKEKWWEVIAKDTTKYSELAQWVHQVWVVNDNGTAKIYTKYVEGGEHFKIYEDENEKTRLINYVKNIDNNKYADFDLISRKVDLGADQFGVSDVKYKFYKIPYKDVQKEINVQKKSNPNYTFVDYYNKLISDDKNNINNIGWQNINVTKDVDNETYLYYKQDALLPNTLYLFMLYPFRELKNGNILHAHYPTPIIVATKPEESTVIPDPTVPNLYINDYTDTTMTLTWKYNTKFNYEIRYSLTEDVDTAEVWNFKLPSDPKDPLYPTDGAYYEVTVDDLFPNTQYYFWIRSKQPANNHISPWSNVAIGTTKDIANPLPPKGIGLASKDSMKKHKYKENVTEDYISIEWILNVDDKDSKDDKSNTQKKFSYLMEVADNPLFIDPIYIESAGGEGDIKPDNVEILEKSLVKVNKLISNRFYYVRMKTRITVTGKEEGQLIVKDSSTYSNPIRILTKYSSSEYDGNPDPELEILPSKDYELVYDKENKELTYRFRSDEKGSNNLSDNNVDQRLIMNLIKHNTYIYNIDISKYKDYPVTKRKVIIPYSIIEAFDSHKVSMAITAGDITMEIPYEALKSTINKNVTQYGEAPSISVKINQFNNYYIEELMPENALVPVGIPQKLGVYVNTRKGTKEINNTDKQINVNVKAKPRYELYGKEIITFKKDTKYNKWQEIDGEYNTYSGKVNFSTGSLGVVGLYITDKKKQQNLVVPTIPTHWSDNARKKITGKYKIKGLDKYNPDNTITENQMLNIMYGILTKERTIDLSKHIDKNTLRHLTNSGINKAGTINNSTLSRQAGIHMFVRTYEIMNDKSIKYDYSLLNKLKSDSDINNSYKESIAKAVKLGLLNNVDNIRAKDNMKYGEMFQIWSKIE
ncbi:MAG: fibronectin type III domain-containing protein [Vallitalea sp.]|nr:fibronectin type III domain-containing protein [Vallitalea sp.]